MLYFKFQRHFLVKRILDTMTFIYLTIVNFKLLGMNYRVRNVQKKTHKFYIDKKS